MAKIYLNGRYPCMANWVILRRRGGRIFAHHCLYETDDELTEREARYLLRLNGRRDPLRIRGFSEEECETYYDEMDELLLLRDPGRKSGDDFLRTYTLFVPKRKMARTILPRVLNDILLCLSIPLFVFSVYRILFVRVQGYFDYGMSPVGCIAGLLVSMVLHEFGHAAACLGYGGWWLEAGVSWRKFIPGAYVMVDDSAVKGRLKKVQINLAGVEMNLLLAGILLTAVTYADSFPPLYAWGSTMIFVALENVAFTLINLTFAEGLDGEHAISLLLGKTSAVDAAKACIRRMFDPEKRRRYLEREGVNGLANVLAGGVIMLFQLLIPLLIFAEIGCVAGVFFG